VLTLLKALFAAIAGLALGLWTARAMLADGGPFDAVAVGAWSVAAKAGAIDADPYTRASLARSGEIPLAAGEGLRLTARTDSDGRKLDARCVYRIGPHAPAARYWTLGIIDVEGFPIENPAGRYVLRSSEIMFEGDGDFAIYLSAAAHSGNWLPIGAPAPFTVVLRLYDSPLSAASGGVEKAATPTIHRESCA
jgi:hypothetical protein